MTDSQLTILVGAIPSTIASVFAGLAYLKSRENGRKADTNAGKVAEIHDATNGMKDALVKATGEAQRAEGKQEERNEERARNALP